MGFFSDFLSPGKGQLTQANAQANKFLERGLEEALQENNAAEAAQLGYYAPFLEQGQAGFDLYNDAIGVNGGSGYGRAFDVFNQDPFAAGEQSEADRQVRNTFAAYNARGMGNSGLARLAAARAASERYGGRVADFRNRLAGAGQMGYGAAGASAAIAGDAGRYRADLKHGYGQQRAGQAINFGNSLAHSAAAGVNNVFKAGEFAAKIASMAMGIPPMPSGGGSSGTPNLSAVNQYTGTFGGGV